MEKMSNTVNEYGYQRNEEVQTDAGCIAQSTTEVLYFNLVQEGYSEDIFTELFRRLRRPVVYMAQGYMQPMSMDEEDMCQEAMLLLWRIIMKNSYRSDIAKFSTFYLRCWEHRLRYLWQYFSLRNLVPLSYVWDWNFKEPKGDYVLQWSEGAERYREQKRLRYIRWIEKKRASKEAA